MGTQVERIENNRAKLTIEVSMEEFEDALEKSYKKLRGRINMPGFRKGKAPRKMIEKAYGPSVLYEEAVNGLIPDAYEKAAGESDLDIVSQPEIDVVQVEKGKPMIFNATVTLKPEVVLGQYKGIEVAKPDTEVSEEEIKEELDRARDQNARMLAIEDRPTEDGDIVTIDFEGLLDGEPFKGGQGSDYQLTLGSHTFVDNFEEQLVGKNIGDEVEVNVTFPETYHSEELKGRPVVFQVKVKEIKMKELPNLDDEFAQDVSEFDTLEEYKEDIRKNFGDKKRQQALKEKEEAIIEKIVENAEMDIPEAMIDMQLRRMTDEFSRRIQAQGMTMENYMQFTGMTSDDMVGNMRPQAVKRIEARLTLEEIVKAEGIVASQEDIEKEIEDMAAAYRMDMDKMKEILGEKEQKNIAMDMAVQKAVDFVVGEAVEA